MSSLARRSLRATAAVAGIAGVVGLAGPAFAAPAAPEPPSTDEAAPAPDTRSTPNAAGSLPKTSELPDLPQLFTIQGTGVYTADHGLPQLPAADRLPTHQLPTHQLPSTDEAVNLGETQQTRDTDVKFQTSAPQEQGSAMQQLDAGSMFGSLPSTGQVLGATEGNDVRY